MSRHSVTQRVVLFCLLRDKWSRLLKYLDALGRVAKSRPTSPLLAKAALRRTIRIHTTRTSPHVLCGHYEPQGE